MGQLVLSLIQIFQKMLETYKEFLKGQYVSDWMLLFDQNLQKMFSSMYLKRELNSFWKIFSKIGKIKTGR